MMPFVITFHSKLNRRLLCQSKATAGIEAGYYVDPTALYCHAGEKCSPYFCDSWPNPEGSADGSSGAKVQAASLLDYPTGWDRFNPLAPQSYGCVKWGAEWPSTGPRTIRQPGASTPPSETFKEALRLFANYY